MADDVSGSTALPSHPKTRLLQAARPELPADLEAERSILGATILAPELLKDLLAAGLEARDFCLNSHRMICAVLLSMDERAVPVDLVSLADELRRRSELEPVGGVAYISDLITGAVTVRRHVVHHVTIVMTKARLRRIQKIGERAVEAAGEPGADPERLTEEIVAALMRIAVNGKHQQAQG